ncbi:MAG TPA: hypothetical protein VK760_01825 [Candidatus Acidoferrales bacterium]|jgi:DNA-binding beta-propeller fold protein YncE|nr:hypothetical protein [Candidatus Acidoferrales bacterium]
MAHSIDRRLFLTSLASTGLTACSGAAIPHDGSPLSARQTRSAVTKTEIYSGLTGGLSVDATTGDVYAVVSQDVMRFSLDGTVKTFPAKNLFLRSVAFDVVTGGFFACGLYRIVHFMPDGKVTGLPIPSALWNRFDPLSIAWDVPRGVLYASNSYYPEMNDVYAFDRGFSTYKSIGKFKKPHGIAVDNLTATVYVADPRERIATISADGTRGTFGSGLLGPSWIARDGADLIVADYYGVRRIGPGGPVAYLDSDISVIGLAYDHVRGATYISTNPGLFKITT